MTENNYSDVRSEARHWLEDLRPDEVETLKGLIKLGQNVGLDRLREGAKLADQVETIGKFSRVVVVGLFGIAVGFFTFAEQIGKFWSLFRGGPK